MDLRYLGYAKSSSPFYTTAPGGAATTFGIEWLPSTWLRGSSGPWVMCTPADVELRQQGWKMHVSATPDNAREILIVAAGICVRERVPFKFLGTREQLITRNSKSADRSASGKFITIYPRDDGQLASLAQQLDDEIGGMPGPFILSDVRYHDGPVFFRFGGFRPLQKMDQRNAGMSYLIDPNGELVEDSRVPIFRAPKWARTPPIVEESIAAQTAPGDKGALGDYDQIKALHFSNSGGVYRATTADGTVTVLKEARPHAGLDRTGRDALARLDQEAANLRALETTGVAPRLLRQFGVWEHRYAEIEYVEATTLKRWNVQNHPFSNRITVDQIEDYTFELMGILHRIVAAVGRSHTEGVVVGDLHPSNILIQPSGQVKLIDLEDARAPDEIGAAPFNAFGYEAPAGLTAAQADWYGVTRLIAAAFYVASPVDVLSPPFWGTARDWISRRFGSRPIALLDEIEDRAGKSSGATTFTPRARIAPWPRNVAGVDIDQAKQTIAAGIRPVVEPPFDGGYPGDIRRWDGTGYLDVATGTAGVLLALSRAGSPAVEAHEDFARAAAREYRRMPFGLLRGSAGLVAALQETGHGALAEAVLQHVEGHLASVREVDLADGLAGIGLALLRFGARFDDPARIAIAQKVSETIIDRLFTSPSPRTTDALDASAGLLQGWSGPALLLAEMAKFTQQARYLDFAERALEADLANTVWTDDGALHAWERAGNRSLPYLSRGTSGMLLPHVAITELSASTSREAQIDGILAACDSREYAFTGLFNGRAGIVASLAFAASLPGAAEIMNRQLEDLFDLALEWDGELVFPGDNYLRLSMDLSTGSAGVLAALTAAEQAATVPWLPIIDAGRPPTAPNGPPDLAAAAPVPTSPV
ncbi:class III lanthionine synthetase LanKC [Microbacterium neimengense]